MKFISKIAMLLVATMGVASCNGPEQTIVDPANVQPAEITSYPTESVVLDRQQPDATQVIVKWNAASFGYKAAITYTLYAQVEQDGGKVRAEIAQTSKLEAAVANKILSAALVKQLGATPAEECKFELLLVSSIGATQYDTTVMVNMNVTPYATDPVPMWVIGMYSDWDHGKSITIYSDNANGIYDGWVPMYKGDDASDQTKFKFTPAANWDLAYGGTLEALSTSGGDIAIEKGFTNLFTLNIPELKATIDKKFTRLGMVGSATPNNWDSPDTELTYDAENKCFKATGVAMKAGAFKFRCDDGWNVCDWGATDTPGRINRLGGGGDITFDKPDGTYTVIVRLFDAYPTYELIAE